MKIVFDTEKGTVKVGSKTFGVDMAKEKENCVISFFNKFVKDHTTINDFGGYEEDSMWMSYRYCIGRHTIAAHMRAGDIAKRCYGRMTRERSIFTAYDINREIEQKMQFGNGPEWHYPITSMNKIYTSALDIFCQFFEDYNITSKEDYLKYHSIDVILSDNERGYKIETTTWEEKLQSLSPVFKELYNVETVEDIVNVIKKLQKSWTDDIDSRLRWIVRNYPNPDYFYFHDIDDMFVWNDLVHLFDLEHHHKSVLTDGSEVEWYWTYVHALEPCGEGLYRQKDVGYERIRTVVNPNNLSSKAQIPDESIIKDLY